MKYFLYSLTHHNQMKKLKQPLNMVLTRGQFKRYTQVLDEPDKYRFKDYRIVARFKSNENPKIKRGKSIERR